MYKYLTFSDSSDSQLYNRSPQLKAQVQKLIDDKIKEHSNYKLNIKSLPDEVDTKPNVS